jgi:hypothetical protein
MQLSSSRKTRPIPFGDAGWISQDPMPRDQEQSHRLHEPLSMVSTIDPINGHDVLGDSNHPSVTDGILTVYFESAETREAFLAMPINHPYSKLPGAPSDYDDRGG